MAGQEHGRIKIEIRNADDIMLGRPLFLDTHSFVINNVAGTEYYKNPRMSDQPSLPEYPLTLSPDDKIVLLFKTDESDTIESEESLITIPILQIDMRGGPPTYKTLEGKDFTDGTNSFGQIDATDIVCTAGQWVEIGYYEVPKQQLIRVGQGKPGSPTAAKLYIYIGDDA